jgi:hypothetical protein
VRVDVDHCEDLSRFGSENKDSLRLQAVGGSRNRRGPVCLALAGHHCASDNNNMRRWGGRLKQIWSE